MWIKKNELEVNFRELVTAQSRKVVDISELGKFPEWKARMPNEIKKNKKKEEEIDRLYRYMRMV